MKSIRKKEHGENKTKKITTRKISGTATLKPKGKPLEKQNRSQQSNPRSGNPRSGNPTKTTSTRKATMNTIPIKITPTKKIKRKTSPDQ